MKIVKFLGTKLENRICQYSSKEFLPVLLEKKKNNRKKKILRRIATFSYLLAKSSQVCNEFLAHTLQFYEGYICMLK